MGLCNSPDIFQEKISSLCQDLENMRTYIYDLPVLTIGTGNEYLQQLETVLMPCQGHIESKDV